MPKPTLTDQLKKALTDGGWQIDPASRTRKYVEYFHRQVPDRRFFVGKGAALRCGKTASSSYSAPIARKRLLEGADAIADLRARNDALVEALDLYSEDAECGFCERKVSSGALARVAIAANREK